MKESLPMLSPKKTEFLKPYSENPVDRDEFIRAVEAGGLSKGGVNFTPLDYFSTPEGVGEEEIKKLIASILKIRPEKVEGQLERLSQCLRESKDFLADYLRQGLPKEIANINSFNSIDDVFQFLSHTKTLKKGEAIGYSPLYCAITSIMLAIYEYKQENFQNLIHEADYLDKKLFKIDQEGGHNPLARLGVQKDPKWSHVAILNDKKETISASYSYRGKEELRTIAKIVKTPELSAKEIIKDGVGLKFEVSSIEDAEKLLTFLTKHFAENFKAKKMIISNIGGIADEKDFTEIKKELEEYEIGYTGFKNPSSNKRWQALKLEGEIALPENGEEGLMLVDRNFEIQITLVDSKNESGLARHEVYERVQKLSVYTRLFGSFTEEYLNMVCEEASQESGLSTKKIKKYILKHFLVKIKTSQHKRMKYASKEHIKRWKTAGKMPKNIEIYSKLE